MGDLANFFRYSTRFVQRPLRLFISRRTYEWSYELFLYSCFYFNRIYTENLCSDKSCINRRLKIVSFRISSRYFHIVQLIYEHFLVRENNVDIGDGQKFISPSMVYLFTRKRQTQTKLSKYYTHTHIYISETFNPCTINVHPMNQRPRRD